MQLEHSGKGMASFVISLVFCIVFGGFVFVKESVIPTEKHIVGVWSPGLIWMITLLIICLILSTVGLVLGIKGLLDKDRKHVFAVLGVIFGWLIAWAITFILICAVVFGLVYPEFDS